MEIELDAANPEIELFDDRDLLIGVTGGDRAADFGGAVEGVMGADPECVAVADVARELVLQGKCLTGPVRSFGAPRALLARGAAAQRPRQAHAGDGQRPKDSCLPAHKSNPRSPPCSRRRLGGRVPCGVLLRVQSDTPSKVG